MICKTVILIEPAREPSFADRVGKKPAPKTKKKNPSKKAGKKIVGAAELVEAERKKALIFQRWNPVSKNIT